MNNGNLKLSINVRQFADGPCVIVSLDVDMCLVYVLSIAVYCNECYADLNNLCSACLNPVDYGDFSDVSEEK